MHKVTDFKISRDGQWVLGAVLLSFAYLILVHGYATGYGWYRKTVGGWLWEKWTFSGGDWNFGICVLPLVGILFWLTRDRYVGLKVKPATAVGVGLVVFALAAYFVGYKANERYFGFFGCQMLVAGVILWFLGWEYFKKGFWLWMLLGSMWPWEFLIEPISFNLQLIMVKLTGAVLTLLGDPAVTNGSALMSKATDIFETGERWSLNIEGACSGMRSLFALGMIGIVYAYLALTVEWKRWVLAACIPVIAILGNLVRMLMLYVGVITMGSEWAIGRGHGNESSFHIGSGLMVFLVALVCLTGLVTFLNRGMKMFKRRAVSRTLVSGAKV